MKKAEFRIDRDFTNNIDIIDPFTWYGTFFVYNPAKLARKLGGFHPYNPNYFDPSPERKDA